MARKAKEATALADRADADALLKAQGLAPLTPFFDTYTVIPTGISSLDHDILGIGGIPCKKLTQIWGPRGAGKTMLAYRILAMAQRQRPDRYALYFDSEFAFNPAHAQEAGVDVQRLQVIQGNIQEEAYASILKYAASGACSVVVLDTIGNLIPACESTNLDSSGEGGKVRPGEFARNTKAFVRDLCRYCYQHDTAAVAVNQITMKIGVLYGDPTDFPGGNNLKHNIQLSLRVRSAGWITEGDEIVGLKVAVTVDRNKMAVAKKTDDSNHLALYFVEGIEKSRVYSVFDDAVRAGVLTKGGAWYKLLDQQGKECGKWQGQAALVQEMIDDEGLTDQIEQLTAGSRGAVSAPVPNE